MENAGQAKPQTQPEQQRITGTQASTIVSQQLFDIGGIVTKMGTALEQGEVVIANLKQENQAKANEIIRLNDVISTLKIKVENYSSISKAQKGE